jgi:2-amino-4-hydroxy-6-hydroxymethyldihydropteridine diphosphokinase
MKHTVFVGLGSNLGGSESGSGSNPQTNVLHALQALNALPRSRVVACSSLYRSAPIGYLAQPDFINAVAQLQTELSPATLLQNLLAMERVQGRLRQFKNAPRTLDLDMLLYDDLQHHEHGLTLPHPQMHLRAFVLQPLLEIAPDCVIPGIGSAAAALNQCQEQKLERLLDKAGKAE